MREPSWTAGQVTVAERWTYHWADPKRPFIHPLTTPAGHVLSREAPADHPWHHGLWFTIKFVNGENYWEELPPFGVLRHDGRPEVTAGADGSLALEGTVTWDRPDGGATVIAERRRLTHTPLAPEDGGDGYAIDLDTTLVPAIDVRLDRTEFTTWGGYGGLTLRGPADLVDTRLLLADGTTHDRLLGHPSPWCDLAGTASAGGRAGPAGVALFDHPANPRFPTPFYASTFDGYGEGAWTNFFNAAFLFHEAMDLAAGKPLRLRHRVVVHDGHWPTERLQAEWDTWAENEPGRAQGSGRSSG